MSHRVMGKMSFDNFHSELTLVAYITPGPFAILGSLSIKYSISAITFELMHFLVYYFHRKSTCQFPLYLGSKLKATL